MKLIHFIFCPGRDIVFPRLLGAEERKTDKIVHMDGFLFCKSGIRRHDKSPDISIWEYKGFVFCLIWDFSKDSEIQNSLVQLFCHLFGIAAGDVVPEIRIVFLEAIDLTGEETDLIDLMRCFLDRTYGPFEQG